MKVMDAREGSEREEEDEGATRRTPGLQTNRPRHAIARSDIRTTYDVSRSF